MYSVTQFRIAFQYAVPTSRYMYRPGKWVVSIPRAAKSAGGEKSCEIRLVNCCRHASHGQPGGEGRGEGRRGERVLISFTTRPLHPYIAGAEHDGFSSTRQASRATKREAP